MKSFHKIVLLFYKRESASPLFYLRMVELWSVIDDVITEQAILKWYQDSHLQKGKSVFLKEMKPMVDWLLTAEEESDSETAAPNSWIIMYYRHTRSRMRIGVFLFCLFARQEFECSWKWIGARGQTWTSTCICCNGNCECFLQTNELVTIAFWFRLKACSRSTVHFQSRNCFLV